VSPSPFTGRVLPVRWLVTLSTLALTVVVVASVGAIAERNTRRALTDELTARLREQASHLAYVGRSALLAPYPELTLHPILRTIRERQPEWALAVVTDRDGVIHGDADARRLGQRFVPPSDLTHWSDANGISIAESPRLLVAIAPIVLANGARAGTVYLGLERGYFDAAVNATRRSLVLALALFLAVGAAGSFLLTSRLLRPIGPLREGLERIGRGDLTTRVAIAGRSEFGRLAAAVNAMAADLQTAQKDAIEKDRLAHEMQLARRIQQSLLPATQIREAGFVLAGWQRPATEVSGDIFDTFRLEDGRLGVAIADVAGKGLPGCLVTTMVAALLAALRDRCDGPADLLATMDERLSPKLERGTFVTLFVAFLDPRTGVLTYASAGHHPALLVRAGGEVLKLSAPGKPLGTDRRQGVRATLAERSVPLEPGDVLVQTTDGVHECESEKSGEPFGFDRVSAGAASWALAGPTVLLDGMARAIEQWRGAAAQLDDETIVVVAREGEHADNGCDPFAVPLERLAEAEARGVRLRLPATLEALVRIDDWLARLPDFRERDEGGRERVRVALYELCANIVEHGYAGTAGQTLSVWWTPGIGTGFYVILDQGKAFSVDNREDPDLGDPGVRRRGRGFGLALVRRAASRLAVHPGTARGNVTLLSFGPSERTEVTEKAA